MSKINQAWVAIQRWLKKLTFKKVFVFFACTLLCLLPTIFASLYVQYNDYAYHTNQFSVTLYDQNQTQLFTGSGIPEKATPGSVVDLFYQLNTKKAPLSKPSGDPQVDDFIVAKLSLNGVNTELKCYFSRFQPQGYCIDQTGKIYDIPAAINDSFLLTEYGELFYSNAKAPILTTIDGDAILPFSNEWHYKAIDGSYLLTKRNETVEDQKIYEITGALGIQFDIPPDDCIIKIYSNGTQLGQCSSLDQLSSISVDTGSLLTLDIQAKWKQSDQTDAFGSVHYNFDVKIRNPSGFGVHTDTVQTGGILLLSCTNISDPSKIKFQAEAEGFSPAFVWDGSVARGILPIPETTDLEQLRFQLSYGASTQLFTVTITQAPHETILMPALNTAQNPNIPLEIQQLLLSLPNSELPSLYFRGNFLTPNAQEFEIKYTHGDTVLYDEERNSFVACGTKFSAKTAADLPVVAWNHGKVIATGFRASLGTFIIVEHGGGLRTIYASLSRTTVEIGEIVQKGQVIGKTGSFVNSEDHGFLVFCSVGSIIIDPSYIMGKAFSFPF